MKDTESAGGVQVIARAAQVLRALEGKPRGLSLAQLAEQVKLPRSTVHRIVSALITEGFLASASPSGRVRIGPEFARLAWAGMTELWRAAEPFMLRIYDALGETVDCSIMDGHRVRVIHVMPARHELRAMADVGATFPLHSSSKGRALLAAYDQPAVRRMLPDVLERFTPNTVTSVDGVMRAVDEARNTGVAYDLEESTLGVCAAAIAVREPSGVLLAISVPVPAARYPDLATRIAHVLTHVRRDALAAFGDPHDLTQPRGTPPPARCTPPPARCTHPPARCTPPPAGHFGQLWASTASRSLCSSGRRFIAEIRDLAEIWAADLAPIFP